MDAVGATDERAICGRRSRVVLTPRRWRQVRRKRFRRRGWQESPVTRESAEEAVNTIACGNAGCPGATVVTNARAYYSTRAAAGATGTRHSPLPFWGSATPFFCWAKVSSTTRALDAARSRRCILPSLRAQRSNPLLLLYCLMDCFAEPVIGRAFARPVGSQ